MSKPLILVTGATGTVGCEVVKQLAEQGERVRALVRDPEKAKKFGKPVEVAEGDMEKPETLAPVFAGVEKAFVVSTGPRLAVMEMNAYDAAKKAGIKHIVKLSGRHVDADFMTATPLSRWHAASEQALRTLGIAWTILRPQAFASNVLMWLDRKQSGIFLPVGDGKDSFIDPRDIAAVAVRVLTSSGHAGVIYELSGSEWLDFLELARKTSAAIGKPVKFVDIPEKAMRDGMAAAGIPAPYAESMLCYFAAIKQGKMYAPTSTVADLLGRPAHSFDDWARHNAALLQSRR